MAGWAGFSDEDLKQMKQTSPGPPTRQTANNATKQAMARKQKIQQQRELARQRALEFAQGGGAPLAPTQRLSSPSSAQPASTVTGQETVTGQAEAAAATQAPNHSSTDSGKPVEGSSKEKSTEEGEGNDPGAGVTEMNEEEGRRVEMNRIEQFRIQQKKMEEENKQRRRLLGDAIKERSKMAKEESHKLIKVQNELKHLDSLVNADVAIIRDKIEAASIDFLQAQKRYEKAEREFVESKMALAEKSDLKESLTEHLYTVIQQNETRKAQRLAVLMKELGLEGEEYPHPLTVPPLLSFSPINTFHRPHAPPTHPPTTPDSSPREEGGGPHGSQSPSSAAEHPAQEAGGAAGQGQVKDQHSQAIGAPASVSEGETAGGKSDKDVSVSEGETAGGKSDKDASVSEGETAGGKSDKDASVGPQTSGAEEEVGKGRSVGSEVEGGDKVTGKPCAENGSPESQDGGACSVVST